MTRKRFWIFLPISNYLNLLDLNLSYNLNFDALSSAWRKLLSKTGHPFQVQTRKASKSLTSTCSLVYRILLSTLRRLCSILGSSFELGGSKSKESLIGNECRVKTTLQVSSIVKDLPVGFSLNISEYAQELCNLVPRSRNSLKFEAFIGSPCVLITLT